MSPRHAARAQDTGLRGLGAGGDLGGLPGSATDAPTLVPDRNAPPSIVAAPTDAEDATPPTTTQNQPDPNDPNFARPRLRKGKLYSPNLKSNPALTSLVPYRTSVRPLRGAAALAARAPQRTGVSPNTPPSPAPNPAPSARDLLYPLLPGPTFAAIPFPVRNSPPALAEADAFAPTGVRVGDLRLLPFVEGSTGFQTNPNQVQAGVRSSAEFRVDAGTAIESDFANHSLTGNVRGGYSLFPSNSNANRPDVSAVLDGRIDVTRDTKINTEARLVVVTQTPGSPLLAVPNSVFITGRPLITSEGATLGALAPVRPGQPRPARHLRPHAVRRRHPVRRLDLPLQPGQLQRLRRGRASLLRADAGYRPLRRDGVRRPRPRQRRRPFRLSPRLARHPRSRRLEPSSSSAISPERCPPATPTGTTTIRACPTSTARRSMARVIYAFSPLTTITLRANTTLSETTLAGASGAISRLVSLEIAHVFFRHFTISGIATYQPNEYQGVAVQEAYTQFTLKGAYSFSREAQLIASASQQNLQSSLVGNGFKDSIFLIGVRLQR